MTKNQLPNKLCVVAAVAMKNHAIGRGDALPWRLSGEMKYFKKLTTSTESESMTNAVIMGRKTYASIPKAHRPLNGRFNVILTNQDKNLARKEMELPDSVLVANSLNEALELLSQKGESLDKIFLIGGASVFEEGLQRCDTLYITRVYGDFPNCDTFFPSIDGQVFKNQGTPDLAPAGIQTENGIDYEYFQYQRIGKTRVVDPALEAGSPETSPQKQRPATQPRHEEYQYLDLVQKILNEGVERSDRTGTGTIGIFGATMRFSLRDGVMPLLTTKRTFWRGVAEELLWFVSGDTNAKTLQDKGIHIWDGNGSRAYLDKIGLTDREEGDLGPVYGFQWRHFGAAYKTMHDDYTGQGVDQVKQLIHTLKTNPTDRRMIVSAWNPAAFHLMALPPCHMFAQFYVSNGELSCQMYQRSADMGLGVPFNIASYSLLTYLVAQCTGLKPGEFIHVIGDCHVYKDHVEPLREQLTRSPTPFPKFKINSDNTDIDGFKYEDFEIIDYHPHKTIKMNMSV